MRRGSRGGKDKCGSWGRVLAVAAHAGGGLVDAGPVEEADGGIAQERHHRGSLSPTAGALVLAQGHVLDPVEAVLDTRVPAFGCATLEGQQAVGWPRIGRQAGDPVAQRFLGQPLMPLVPMLSRPE